jgi:hypothetical protein
MVDRGTALPGPDGPRAGDEQSVAALVRGLAPLTAPDQAARARMRARILSGLADPDAAEDPGHRAGSATATAEPPGSASRRPVRSRAPRGRGDSTRPGGELPRLGAGLRGRFAIAAVAMLALVLSLAGMSLLLARDALPGDTLYGVKRTAEAASLGLTFGDESRAVKHLEFAAARVTEIETLARRYTDPSDTPVGAYLTALSDFDNDATAGSRQLIALATRNDGRQLESVRDWARQQTSRLDAVAARMPDSARNRAGATLTMLTRITARAEALLTRMSCYQITTGSFDEIGALPATGACERVPGSGGPAPNTPNAPGGATAAPAPGTPGAPTPGTAQQPTQTVPLPEVPLPPAPNVPPGLPPGGTPGGTGPTLTVPLPLPPIEVPPLLPGLPGVSLGG